MKDIEQCTRERNTQEYWNKIKELAGWRKGGNKKLPEALIDAEGTEKVGTDRLKVAADTFRKLGEDDQNDPDFDFEFAERVRKQVEQLEEEEMTEEEECIMRVFDVLCFTGTRHMKRLQGIKAFPVDMLYKCSKIMDLLDFIAKMFKERLNNNNSMEENT